MQYLWPDITKCDWYMLLVLCKLHWTSGFNMYNTRRWSSVTLNELNRRQKAFALSPSQITNNVLNLFAPPLPSHSYKECTNMATTSWPYLVMMWQWNLFNQSNLTSEKRRLKKSSPRRFLRVVLHKEPNLKARFELILANVSVLEMNRQHKIWLFV